MLERQKARVSLDAGVRMLISSFYKKQIVSFTKLLLTSFKPHLLMAITFQSELVYVT